MEYSSTPALLACCYTPCCVEFAKLLTRAEADSGTAPYFLMLHGPAQMASPWWVILPVLKSSVFDASLQVKVIVLEP